MSAHETIRVPPNNDEAERSAIGAALIDNRAIDDIAAIIEPGHFYRESHRHIWRAILAVHERGEAVDEITLCDELKVSALLDAVGGQQVIKKLSSEVPSAANVEHYAQIVRKKAALREVIKLAHALTDEAYEDVADVGAWGAERVATLQLALEGGRRSEAAETPHNALALMTRRLEERLAGIKPEGVSWPLAGVQAELGNFAPKSLTILAARPGVGKSALAVQIAQMAAVGGEWPVMLFSLEMDAEEIGARILSQRARVSYERMSHGSASVGEWARWVAAHAEVAPSPLYIKDDVTTLRGILATASAAIKRQGVRLVVVDYLQLIDHKAGNREQAVAEISRALKLLAQTTGVAVLALSQLSREVEKRSSKQPFLSDLRESGSIEQDANRVLFLWRADDAHQERLTLTVAKNRGGKTNLNFELNFKGECYLFEQVVEERPEW
jgi:replicative DNA helicase